MFLYLLITRDYGGEIAATASDHYMNRGFRLEGLWGFRALASDRKDGKGDAGIAGARQSSTLRPVARNALT